MRGTGMGMLMRLVTFVVLCEKLALKFSGFSNTGDD